MLYAKSTITATNVCLIPIPLTRLQRSSCADYFLGSGPQFHSGNFPIESIRAAHLAGEPREQRFCSDCTPHLCDEEGPVTESILDIIYANSDYMSWCLCSLADKFIDDRWLCIPCFIKQEAKAYSRRFKTKVFTWETNEDGSRKLVGTVVCFSWLLLDYC